MWNEKALWCYLFNTHSVGKAAKTKGKNRNKKIARKSDITYCRVTPATVLENTVLNKPTKECHECSVRTEKKRIVAGKKVE